MTGSSRDKRYRAFTLVEILVSLGIVLVLLAILIPALVKARESANSAVCLANVRALSIDYNDYCSTMTHMSNGWLYDYGMWLTELAPIIGNPGSSHIDDKTGINTPYITPDIQKLAICPATNLPPGFALGAVMGLAQSTVNQRQSADNVAIGENVNNPSIRNNAINPAVTGGVITEPNAYTTWAVGDITLNQFTYVNTTTGMKASTVKWFFGSYGFNAWLYNGYNSSSQNNTPTYSIGGDINSIPYGQLYTTLSNTPNASALLPNAQANNPNISSINQLVWNSSGQSPTPSTPVFFDSMWMEAAPTYLDAPATGGSPQPGGLPVGVGSQLTSSGMQKNYPALTGPNVTAQGMFYPCISRHGASINVGFADGHAENVSLGNLWKLQWSATPPTPTGTAQTISLP